ncbi:hypothetical protein UFOVP19_53 [uncultured Caudovirales phage]|uniref:Uncharacterized protein n=1 Tax=uncultured Caudovirales phage TaxID=2100421 RepID=A0A6J5KLT2_9CAUD|nr:hypothetical protein UFOVP19_53 [uncultured Caudovirales phage]
MAITIQSSPAPYSSMHDSLWYVSSSSNVGQTSFKFVYDVYVNGSQVSRTKIFPAPSAEGSYGVFNASPMVRAFATNYFEPSGSSILQASNNKLRVDATIQVGEEYVSGGNMVTLTNLVSGALSAYNYYQPMFADVLYTTSETPLVLSDYYDNLLIENFSDEWLTERDVNEIDIEHGDNFYATYFRKTAGTYYAKIDVLNEAGSVVDYASGGITLSGEMNLFNFGAANINTFVGRELVKEYSYGYNVYLGINGAITTKLKFTQKCYPKYRQYNLHFLNRLGGWDTMKFALVNKRSTDFTRSNYRKSSWQLSGNKMTNVDSFNRFNETTMNYSIQQKFTYHLISDWVSGENYSWLEQLIASSIVYLEFQGAYFPVTINTTNFKEKTETADKLFNFEIDVEVSKYINSQYR